MEVIVSDRLFHLFRGRIQPTYMDVSKNGGSPKSSILIGFSIINHPFWGTPIFGNTHIETVEFDPIKKKKQWPKNFTIPGVVFGFSFCCET